MSRTSDTAATIGFTTDEAGTAYYLVKNAGETAPASAAVKAGASLGAVTAGANTGKAVTLTAGAKDIYVVVEDAAGNISAPLKIAAAAYDPGGGDLLSGSITITVNGTGVTTANVGDTLTAVYDGNEDVTYQWKRGTTDLGTDITQIAEQVGSYTVTVSAAGYQSKTSDAVTVSSASGISLRTQGGASTTFATVVYGYSPVTELAIFIDNESGSASLDLAIGLSGNDAGSFELSKTSILNINDGQADFFTVKPKNGLAGGKTYTASVTVKGVTKTEIDEFIEVSIKVMGIPSAGDFNNITLPTSAIAWVPSPAGITITSSNALIGSATNILLASEIGSNVLVTFDVTESEYYIAANGLSAGNITVTPLEDVAHVAAWLNGRSEAGTIDDPKSLPVKIALGDTSTNWSSISGQQLLTAIGTAAKYVDLDLSECSMSGTMFHFNSIQNTETVNGAFLSYIVSVTLPDDAEDFFAVVNLTNIKTFNAESVLSIPNDIFANRDTLKSVSFPNATVINARAFFRCTSLESVNLPKVETINNDAFSVCESLEIVNIPLATIIGYQAFASCVSLESVSLPKVTSIGDFAFNTCTSLTDVIIGTDNGGVVATLGQDALSTGSGSQRKFYVPDSLVANYKAATNWSQYASYIFGISTRP